MISESTINQVRNLSIEDVLRPYVKLSRKGSTLMGLCPFHEERTGSFAVSPIKNLFHCFSCNRGGDAIAFIMEKENLSFIEAVEFIAKNNNIVIEYVREEKTAGEPSEARVGMYPPFLKEKSPVRKRDEAEFPRGTTQFSPHAE